MSSNLKRVIFTLLVANWTCAHAAAAPPVSAEGTTESPSLLAAYALDGFEATLLRVRTATGRAVGRHGVGSIDPLPEDVQPVFYDLNMAIRIDRPAGALSTDLSVTSPSGTESKQLITTPTRTLRFRRADEQSSPGMVTQTDPLVRDVAHRASGHLIDPLGVALRGWIGKGQPIEDGLAIWRGRTADVIDVRQGGDQLWEIVFLDTPPNSFYGGVIVDRIWLDASRGFLPVKRETHWAANTLLPDIRIGRLESSETTWTESNGAWLPETIRLHDYENRAVPRSLELSFTWGTVNRPLPGAAFDWRGMDLPAGLGVYDTREAAPVKIGVTAGPAGPAGPGPAPRD